jgi:SAM-dependent methyltransferase
MNRNKLKQYASQARRDFIAAVTDRAAYYGLTKRIIEPITEQGDVAFISGKPLPRSVAAKRQRLEGRIKQRGFEPVMKAMAYTWFNRLVAIRYMELHGYLDHGYRVLSHPEGGPTPEILEHLEHVDLPGLKKETVIDLKLAGNREGELYRLLLTAQCNALHKAMPFLFEKIDDETELLLPDNLLHSDSLIRKLVSEIDEEDWQEVEIIGWLYQFYISEKKDQVIGKEVASEDIPAATQLFTPNWIVKYLVQNTLGRQWLATYPQSALRQQMAYYIEPAEQTPEVQEQLKAITPTNLNPEELTLLDPACGSGHILVEAYDLFKAIYQERGYRARDIPALILQKNLFGLEIDDRAAQLAAFALMMKARADDRRLFDGEAKPNILAFQDSRGMDAADITHALNAPINKEEVPSEYLFEEIEEEKAGLFSKKALAEKGHVSQGDIAALLALFENAKTFGSLIQVPPKLAAKLPEIEKRLDDVLNHGDLSHASAHVLKPLFQQAHLLSQQYDAVVANPPYLNSKSMDVDLKRFVSADYADNKRDLFAAFAERIIAFNEANGYVGLMTPFVWMFIQSFEALRAKLISDTRLLSLIQPEYHAFFDSAFVPICAFCFQLARVQGGRTVFIDLSSFYGMEQQPLKTLEAIRDEKCAWRRDIVATSFAAIPGSPFAYQLGKRLLGLFSECSSLSSHASVKEGLNTGNNALFFRNWSEVEIGRIAFECRSADEAIQSERRWFPCQKGGGFRRWFGNNENVIEWENDGQAIRNYRNTDGEIVSAVRNAQFYFREGLTWSGVGASGFSVRWFGHGFLFNSVGRSVFPNRNSLYILGYLNSSVCGRLLTVLSPTLNFSVGDIARIPIVFGDPVTTAEVESAVTRLIELSRCDWSLSETSWDFQQIGYVKSSLGLPDAYQQWVGECKARIDESVKLEEQVNRLISRITQVDEVSHSVADDAVSLYKPSYEEDMRRLLSYAIGCMMGRYSLDKPGLIYAHSGNQEFDPSQYKTFRADDDGIIPLLEADSGIRDDAANRIAEFISVAWPREHLQENLKFIAESLGPNNGEQPRDTIRRYLATGFYKHHLSMYKKRPIYWLFSSGKQRAFQCLVYLHRYNESTLSRIRTEYVIPRQGKIASRIGQLADDIAAASSTSHRKKLEKERDALVKQQAELRTFDEKLRHYADKRISLDLGDGVKVNYGKFGDLLADARAVTGGTEEP